MWIELTLDNVRAKLAAPELAALRTVSLSTGQADPLPETIAQVTREVRGYVAACERNRLAPGSTVPDELAAAALNRIRYELATRLPAASLLTDARKESNKDAIRLLERAAGCDFAIEQPPVSSEETTSSMPAPRWSARSREWTRAQQDGR